VACTCACAAADDAESRKRAARGFTPRIVRRHAPPALIHGKRGRANENGGPSARHRRSEEHTSELQSRENLVCRLLLEKKKPMTGQYGHFSVYAPEPVPYAIDRYTKEALRLLGVVERRLAGRASLTGDYPCTDMAAYPWIIVYARVPLDLAPFPEVRCWQAAIAARPATQRAYALSKQVNPAAGAFFFNAAAAALIYTLSLHDALPI